MRRGIVLLALLTGCAVGPDRVSGLRPVSPGAPDFETDFGQATLRWESFPTKDMPAEVRERVRDVTYDLEVYDQNGLVYSRQGLPEPEHKVECLLEPGKTYEWTLRARFTIDGRPRTTQWTEAPPYRSRQAECTPVRPRGIPAVIPREQKSR